MKNLRLILALALLVGLWGCRHFPNSVPHSPTSSSAASSASAEPVRLITPSLAFEGQTYYLCYTGSAALPAGLKIAFTCQLKDDGPGLGEGPVNFYLMRLAHGSQAKVVQAFQLPVKDSRGHIWLGDLYGDGRLELFTSAYQATAPNLKITPVTFDSDLRYSNGKGYGRLTGENDGEIYVFKLDGEITQLFENRGGHGVAGAIAVDKNGKNEVYCGMTFDFYWADLYGNGRPVLCQVCNEVDTPKDDPKNAKHTRKLCSHWEIDPGTGNWREVGDGRQVDADAPWPQSLFGLLAPPRPVSSQPPNRAGG